MVQRKLPSKLGIQTGHVKSEKRLGSLGPSSPRHQDCKNRGAELRKKKMKKSRSFKVADFESLRSETIRREVPQPGKPPTTLDKKSPIGRSESSPNYMKSTSSFDARKEQSQGSKTPRKMISNNTKLGSVSSSHKQTKTSSLKLARTPSFKPARGSTKKCSQVVLCGDVNPQRGTCSSTLKDSRFPSYLALSPGATESEGTSVMRVCPYSHCSLNGHHHPPLPPLKCFLSARRRAVKTQKSVKLGCLSPRRPKRPSCDNGTKEVIPETTLDEKPAILQREEENQMDFFVEIYVKGTEYGCGINETAEKNDGGQVVESFVHEAPCSESEFEENLDGGIEVISSEMEIAEFLPEEEKFSPSAAQEEEVPETPRTEFDEMDSETCDMEAWDDEVDNSSETNGKNDLENGSSPSSSSSSSSLIDDEFVSGHFDEIPADKELEQFYEEEGESSGAGFSDRSFVSEDQSLGMSDEIALAPVEEDGNIETIQSSDKQSQSNIVEDQNHSYKDFHKDFSDSEEQTPAGLSKIIRAETGNADANEIELKDSPISPPERTTFPSSEENPAKTSFVRRKRHSIEEPADTPINLRIVRCKRGGEELEERAKEFNPKEPNYLAIEAEPEPEKVDLRHQMMDERKNAEEWMIDYALQQAVTKLAPARKRKVALLVEAFEKVIPTVPKYGSNMSHGRSPAFSHSRPPLQACS